MEKSEDNLIAWIADRCKGAPIPIGIGDDMAMLPPSGPGGLLVTTDMIMDGIDFDSRVHTPEQIGRKALAVNLSDCAAMAVRPRWALVSVALPNAWSMEQAQALYAGMEALAKKYGVQIVGGDTNSWDQPLVIDVTVLAEPWPGSAPTRRSSLHSGDRICVTGRLGGSLAGHHLEFEPRVEEARALAEHFGPSLHAMMDISDGLSTDAARMANASQAGIEFDAAALEAVASESAWAAAASDGRTALDHVLNDGEDFELLLAIDPQVTLPPMCTPVGRAVAEPIIWLRTPDGKRHAIRPGGWQHFVNP